MANNNVTIFNGRKIATIENVKFAFGTHFGANNPDTFGNTGKGTLMLSAEQAAMLSAEGVRVRQSDPRPDHPDDEVRFYADVRINFESKWPPKIFLITEGRDGMTQLDGATVGVLDNAYIVNVDLVVNLATNKRTGSVSMYADTMYCTQDVSSDPFAAKYSI